MLSRSIAQQNFWDLFRATDSWQYPMNPRIEAQLKWFVANPGYIERVALRGSPLQNTNTF